CSADLSIKSPPQEYWIGIHRPFIRSESRCAPASREPPKGPATCFAGVSLDAARCPEVWLKKWLFDVVSNKVTRRVSEANDLVPVARSRRIGINQRPKSHRNASRPGHDGFVSQNLPRAADRYRADWPVRVDGSLKCAQLKRTYSRDRCESPLGINHHGFAPLERRIHFLRLLNTRLRIVAVERELPAALAQPADQRHVRHFSLGDKPS